MKTIDFRMISLFAFFFAICFFSGCSNSPEDHARTAKNANAKIGKTFGGC